MDLSILVARIAAVAYLAMGISMFSGDVDFKKMFKSFEGSPGLTLIAGLFSLIIGMLLIEFHNIWVKNWTVLITIIGWGATFKGVMYLAFPKWMFSFSSVLVKNSRKWSVLVIIIGLVMGYFGFLAQ